MYIKQENLEPHSPNTSENSSSDDSLYSPSEHRHHSFQDLHNPHHHHEHTSAFHPTPTSNSRVKRLRANDRERRRVHLINCAMDELRDVVPGLKDKRKLTKLDLLRAANHYIWMLDEALRSNRSIDQIQQRVQEAPPRPIPIYYVTYEMPRLKREPSL